jgi:hypothetical protein
MKKSNSTLLLFMLVIILGCNNEPRLILQPQLDPALAYPVNDGGYALTCFTSLNFKYTPSFVSIGSWIRITWVFSGCSYDPIILAVYRNGIYQADVSGEEPFLTVGSSEFIWKVPDYRVFGGYSNLQIKILSKADRSILATSSYFNYSACYGGVGNVTGSPVSTYLIGSSYSSGFPVCTIENIPYVTLVLIDRITFKRFVIAENIPVGTVINYVMPVIPAGITYSWQWEIPGYPQNYQTMYHYPFKEIITVTRNSFDGLATVCNSGNLYGGDLTSVNWDPNIFAYDQVTIELYISNNLILTTTFVPNNGKYVFGVSEANNWKVCVRSKYSAFAACSSSFNVYHLGVLGPYYNQDKSNCNFMLM